MLSLTAGNKFDVLIGILSDYREYIHKLEGRSIQIVLSVSTGSIVVPIFFLEKLRDASSPSKIGCSMFLCAVAIATLVFLVRTRAHCNWLRRAIVRILQVLSAYDDSVGPLKITEVLADGVK